MQPLLGTRGSARPGHHVARSRRRTFDGVVKSARRAPRPTASTPRAAATDGCRSGGEGVRSCDHALDLWIRSPSQSSELEERPGHGPDPSFCIPQGSCGRPHRSDSDGAAAPSGHRPRPEALTFDPIRGSWQLGPSAIGSPKSRSRSEGVGRFYLHERTSRLSSLSSGSGRGHSTGQYSKKCGHRSHVSRDILPPHDRLCGW